MCGFSLDIFDQVDSFSDVRVPNLNAIFNMMLNGRLVNTAENFYCDVAGTVFHQGNDSIGCFKLGDDMLVKI